MQTTERDNIHHAFVVREVHTNGTRSGLETQTVAQYKGRMHGAVGPVPLPTTDPLRPFTVILAMGLQESLQVRSWGRSPLR